MFIFFNSTFLPLFALGMMGMPRRVFEYARNLQTLNDWVSISAFCLGGSLLIFLINFIMSTLVWRVKGRQPVELPRAGMAGVLAAAAGELRAHSRGSLRALRVRREGCTPGG